MRTIIFWVFVAIIAAMGIGLAILNTTPVAINFHYSSIELPLALLVGVSLGGGLLLGILVSVLVILRLKRQIAHLERSTQQVAAGTTQLRTIPLKQSA